MAEQHDLSQLRMASKRALQDLQEIELNEKTSLDIDALSREQLISFLNENGIALVDRDGHFFFLPKVSLQFSTKRIPAHELIFKLGNFDYVLRSDNTSELRLVQYECYKFAIWNSNQSVRNQSKFCDALSEDSSHDLAEKEKPYRDEIFDWAAYHCCWAAQHCAKLTGDFVECGVHMGRTSSVVNRYANLTATRKKFYLFDTFCGIPPDQAGDKIWLNKLHKYDWDYYEAVRTTFKDAPNIILVRGRVPETLQQVDIEKVAYLSIDMNAVEPEIAALNFFWPKLVSSGMVILDDYGHLSHQDQRKAMDNFARENNLEILQLPTGQGLIVKP